VAGLSGAGKSAFIRCLNRLENPTSGRVLAGGRDLASLGRAELLEARRGMKMVFQSFNLLTCRTVRDNVAFPLQIAGFPKKAVRDRTSELVGAGGPLRQGRGLSGPALRRP
jgi:D-methionine transport system ATP-binding protein